MGGVYWRVLGRFRKEKESRMDQPRFSIANQSLDQDKSVGIIFINILNVIFYHILSCLHSCSCYLLTCLGSPCKTCSALNSFGIYCFEWNIFEWVLNSERIHYHPQNWLQIEFIFSFISVKASAKIQVWYCMSISLYHIFPKIMKISKRQYLIAFHIHWQ